ncbi:ATP phosphoribosyltransferase [Candidatus Carsonella ruddii CS isolate Thao2000]|uniref:ATP phosphoribosyltransferase n=1 Tax=Candidatus Carsonella ruddii CS isolate Thao2000 TaxID=1202537 RepID=J7H094_CARRU|nr:hypothetical protein [Candidatus Carsonella ruddii]AFP83715.1 ATP phosphoribosyltransferase [Candidatus Carsonella ruddii CS isolate Thao2000]
MFIISISKGRIFILSLIILFKIKIFIIEKIYRKLILKTNRKNIIIILIKNKDLIKSIKLGFSNLNILGDDSFNIKKKINIIKIKSILFYNSNKFIITKFIFFIKKFFIKNMYMKFNGSLEVFTYYNKIGILEISETNKTLYENMCYPKIFLKKINICICYNNIKKFIFKILKC